LLKKTAEGLIDMDVSIPWYARIAAKLALASLPIPYSFWKKIGIYSHGEMQDADYVFRVFDKHLISSGLSGRAGLVGLEMGPGDSVGSAVAAKAKGFSAFYLVDAGDFANRDVETYKEMGRIGARLGLAPPDLERASSFEDILSACDAIYSTNGMQSYREIPAASVDLIFSQAVLEHVRRNEFVQIAAEMRRILKPDGVASHQVDLRDHLGGGLNNMRISSGLWETELMSRSGFYTNRIRFSEMCGIFERAGFLVDVESVARWNTVPIPIKRLAPEFRHFSEEELLVSSFHVLLRPQA
jgi:SAM-dependent methyltransferase